MTEANWARELARGAISENQLKENGWISQSEFEQMKAVKEELDIRVPQQFFKHIDNNVEEIAKQFIPSSNELIFLPEELSDPIGDEVWTPVKGVTHRYKDRILLKATYQCASYCRFCFRRYKVSDSNENLTQTQLSEAFNYIKNNPQIWEVILTGGDPLVLSSKRIRELLQPLQNISHVKVIRIHTRVLTVLPTRIDDDLINALNGSGKSVWIVAHINSAKEITPEAEASVSLLKKNQINLLSQSVFLKGVNDSCEALESLFRNLIILGIKPYYLHYPDLAQGTGHFRMSLEKAIEIYSSLRGRVSGICLPQLMIDIPGGHGKVPADKAWIKCLGDGKWEFTSPLDQSTIKISYPN